VQTAMRPPIVFLAIAVLTATACGAEELPVEAGGVARLIEHDGISLQLPAGWKARVLALDYPSAVMQAANFEFATSTVLPPGEEDPIKAMTSAHVLVSIAPCGIVSFEESPRPPPQRVTLDALMFFPAGHPLIPVGHALAHAAFQFDDGCVRIEVDFGAEEPSVELTRVVDDVLGSLVIAPR
jgi:hypothetical protein